MGESPLAERVAGAQEQAYGPLVEWARQSPLHTDVLGHSLHPSWGGDPRRVRTAGVRPAALAGTADWAELSGAERRIGAVHALATDAATFLFVGSLVARARGGHRTGTRLAVAANPVMVGAGFLGGHLALHRGTARRASVAESG